MANVDRPNGAEPLRTLSGRTVFQTNPYSVDASNSTAIFPGDFLIREADGNVAPATAGTGVELIGVCESVADDYGDLSRVHLPASTAGTVNVWDSPDIIFAVQEDDGGTALAAADQGTNVAIIAGTGSTTTGRSAHELDQDSKVATTEQLRLLRLVNVEGNAYGDNALWEVLINEHELKEAAGV